MGGSGTYDADGNSREEAAAETTTAEEAINKEEAVLIDSTSAKTPMRLHYFHLDLEYEKVLLRRFMLASFCFWLLLGLLLWWWVTIVPRAPLPSIESYRFAARMHASSRASPTAPAFVFATTSSAATLATATAEAEVEAAARAAAAAGAASGEERARVADIAAAKQVATAAAIVARAAVQRTRILTNQRMSLCFLHKYIRRQHHSFSSALHAASIRQNSDTNVAADFDGTVTSDYHLPYEDEMDCISSTTSPNIKNKEKQNVEKYGVAASFSSQADADNLFASLSPQLSLLPPLTLVFGLRLLPLCTAAANDARHFYHLLLSRSSTEAHPLYRSLFSADNNDSSMKRQQQQQQEEATVENTHTPHTIEAAFTAALDVVFGGGSPLATPHAHTKESNTYHKTAAKGRAYSSKATASEEARHRVLLEQSASLFLLRVELLQPLSSACASSSVDAEPSTTTTTTPADHFSATAATAPVSDGSDDMSTSFFSSQSPFFPETWTPAAVAMAQENEAALVYTVGFSASVWPPPSVHGKQQQQRQTDAAASQQQQKTSKTLSPSPTRHKNIYEEQRSNQAQSETTLPPPKIVLHADSAATIYSSLISSSVASPTSYSREAASTSIKNASAGDIVPTAAHTAPIAADTVSTVPTDTAASVADTAATAGEKTGTTVDAVSGAAVSWRAAADSWGSSSSSFLLHGGPEALYHLLQTTVFRRHTPLAAGDAVTPGQYEFTFWLAGDPPPHSGLSQQHQRHQRWRVNTQEERQQQHQQRQQLQQERKEWGRLQCDFEHDVLGPYLLPFFSRMALLYTFPSIQSQVVPLSGIASLLKKAPRDYFAACKADSMATCFSSEPFHTLFASDDNSNIESEENQKDKKDILTGEFHDDLFVLDVASQHQLHVVSSRWQPQQIVSVPTYFPAPLLFFVYYKPPVQTFIVHEVRGTSVQRRKEREGGIPAIAPTTDKSDEQQLLLATHGVYVPGWGALVVGPPPFLVASASSRLNAAESPGFTTAASLSSVDSITSENMFSTSNGKEKFIAAGGEGSLKSTAHAPVSAAGAADTAVASSVVATFHLDEEERRYASAMWIAQLRSIFLLPSTLRNYFSFSPSMTLSSSQPDNKQATPIERGDKIRDVHSNARGLPTATKTNNSAAEKKEDDSDINHLMGGRNARNYKAAAAANESNKEKHSHIRGPTALLEEGWEVELVSDGSGSISSRGSSSGGALVLRMIQRQYVEEQQEAEAAARLADGKPEDDRKTTAGRRTMERRDNEVSGEEMRRKRNKRPHIDVVMEAAPSGAGLWEVWDIARQVYVNFILEALRNIHRLQSIIDSQPELVVLPHIAEAQNRALVLIQCSGEAVVLHRICSQLPPPLRDMLLEGLSSSHEGLDLKEGEGTTTDSRFERRKSNKDGRGQVADNGFAVNHGGSIAEDSMADHSHEQSGNISNARFLFFALALARAAFQDSLEVSSNKTDTTSNVVSMLLPLQGCC